MNYILLGPPGSGKGTQAKNLAQKLNITYFGAGDLMRQASIKKTPLGKKFQAIWDKKDGSLFPEELVSQFVAEKIKEIPKNTEIIFDGYPRTIKQAQDIEKMLPEGQFTVININVSAESLIDRMSTRRVCDKCGKIFFQAEKMGIGQCDVCGGQLIRRQDDDPEVVKKRIDVYNEETRPLIGYYRRKGILLEIDGEPPIEQVEKQIWEKVNERRNSN